METTTTKTCPRCKQEKPVGEFGVWGRYKPSKTGQPRTYCRECERQNSRNTYLRKKNGGEVKEKMVAYLPAPNGQMLDLWITDSGYQLRESRD